MGHRLKTQDAVSRFTLQFELPFATLVGAKAKIIRFPFLNMTFMTFQERACIL